MARRKNHESFVKLTRELIRSQTFLELTNAARTAYIIMRDQVNNRTQRTVRMPYSYAEKYMKTNTFAAAIKQLEEKGFITKEQEGGLYRRTNVYSFSERWRGANKPPLHGISIWTTENGSVGNTKHGQTATHNGSVETVGGGPTPPKTVVSTLPETGVEFKKEGKKRPSWTVLKAIP